MISLPYPPKELSPNARNHWAVKSTATKNYRHGCAKLAEKQGLTKIDAESLDLRVIFCPPDRRPRDRDNAIAAFKAGQDAIADVTGIDDHKFQVTYAPGWGNPIKGGAVIVEIGETPNVKG